MIKNQNTNDQINANNPWYIDEQFSKQYNRRGPRAVIEKRWEIFQKAIENLSKKIEISPANGSLRILDAGCGDGINLFGLNRILQTQNLKAHIYGIDYNPLRLERASQFAFVEELIQSPLDDLPYPDEYFDVVLCNQVLEHIPQDQKVLKELNRVVKSRGMFILGVPNEGCFLGQLRNNVIQRSILKKTDHVNFYTEKKVMDLLGRTGFSTLNVEKPGFLFPHSTLHYAISFTNPGRWFLNLLGKLWKSQCAELIIVCIKK